MLAVIFEVQPKAAEFHRYLDIAGSLRPELARIDGFVAIERFESRRREHHVLSLSIWHNEGAIARWRGLAAHRAAQLLGRSEIFGDYRLRVGKITTDEPEPATAGNVTVTEWPPSAAEAPADPPVAGVVEAEEFDSLSEEGKRLLLVTWCDDAAADAWRPGGGWRHRRVHILRDYGMFERAAAPQYYPPVLRPG
jgi:heme-degrading monooxygenase HmoA